MRTEKAGVLRWLLFGSASEDVYSYNDNHHLSEGVIKMSLLSEIAKFVKTKKCTNCGKVTTEYEIMSCHRMKEKKIEAYYCEECCQKYEIREMFHKYLTEKGILNDGLKISGEWHDQ